LECLSGPTSKQALNRVRLLEIVKHLGRATLKNYGVEEKVIGR
jgi:hypothetical protein